MIAALPFLSSSLVANVANWPSLRAGRSGFVPVPAVWLLLVLLFLSGCASPTGVQLASSVLPSLGKADILVATNRKPAEKAAADFSGERSDVISYAAYDVTIPPNHKVGQIEWPGGKADPARHFAVARATPYGGQSKLIEAINQKLSKPSGLAADGSKEVVLFVHGYNTDFSESLYRTAQMKHDFEIGSPMVLFSWPSAGDPSLYIYDRDSVKASRDALASVITALIKSNAEKISLTAHSLGTELLMETLRQMALSSNGHLPKKINYVVLISPDLDLDVFNNQLNAIKRLPESFAIFVSANDKALQLSSFLSGDDARVGNNIDESKIKRSGIFVFDVTQFSGGDDLNHMTAATSPSLIKVLKGVAQSGDRPLAQKRPNGSNAAAAVVNTATLPIELVVKTTKAIFNPQDR